jgi:hypothetical protein
MGSGELRWVATTLPEEFISVPARLIVPVVVIVPPRIGAVVAMLVTPPPPPEALSVLPVIDRFVPRVISV